MKEIGGYMEFEHFHGKEFHENAIGLNCGRNALAYLIEAHHIESIYLPCFLCSSVAEVCRKYSVSLHFYSIREDFTPIVPDSFGSSDWLYVVNYYGQLDDAFLLGLGERNVVVDNAQAFFRMPLPGAPTLYTCRKFFGVSDGAYLYTDKLLERSLEIDESYNRMGFVLGRFERSAGEFYRDASDNNGFFSGQPVKQMSRLTKNCLKAIDYELVRTRRTKNFSYLHAALGQSNKLPLAIPDGAFAYPLYVENGVEVRRELAQSKIFIPTLWPDVLDTCSASSIECQYAANILPLPVDQRYGGGGYGEDCGSDWRMYRLREIQRQDIPEINSWRNNEDIISTLGAPFRFINQEVDEKWFEQYMLQRNNTVRCAITTKENDKILGIVSLVEIDFINSSAQFHIMIGESGQNKGAGTFAVKAMVGHGFNNYGLHRIELHVLAENKRARHVYEKCGFVQEGTRRQAVFKNGKFEDMIVYSIINNGDICKFIKGGGNLCLAALYSRTEKEYAMAMCDNAFARSVLRRGDFNSLFEKIDTSAFFGVGYRDDVMGYVAMYANDLQTRVAYITLIGVRREWQNSGVGTALMDWCISVAQSRGMRSIKLEVDSDNVNAQKFYKKHGFVFTGNGAGGSFYMVKNIEMQSNYSSCFICNGGGYRIVYFHSSNMYKSELVAC